MFLIDSHCHLNQLDYKIIHKDISDVLRKAYQKNVKLMLSVSTSISDYEVMVRNIGCRPEVIFSCGVHPVDVYNIKNFDYDKLKKFSCNKNVVAIGETGLDYYHSISNIDIQKVVFRKHIAVAKDANKPIIVHSRNAINDTITVLHEEHAEKVGGVLHCFSEDIDSAKILLDMSFYISFSGIITFQKVDRFKKIIQYVPLDRILLETDSPYLTPVPYRGQENQPAYVYEIAKYIANIKKISLDNIAFITTSNFYKLFQIL